MAAVADNNSKISKWIEPILRSIECPACLEHMGGGTIHLCRNGHSLCSICRKALRHCPICRSTFSTMRNYQLESLAENVPYPCKYAAQGCESYVMKTGRDKHESNCDHRIYSCMIKLGDAPKCTWSGQLCDLKDHSLDVHPGQAWMQEDNMDRWKPGDDPENEVQLMTAHGELFYFTRLVQNEVMFFGLNYIGPDQNAKLYGLQMEFPAVPTAVRCVEWSDYCQTINTAINGLILEGMCFGLSKAIIQTFKNKTNGIWFKVQVNKNDSLQDTLVDRGNYEDFNLSN